VLNLFKAFTEDGSDVYIIVFKINCVSLTLLCTVSGKPCCNPNAPFKCPRLKKQYKITGSAAALWSTSRAVLPR